MNFKNSDQRMLNDCEGVIEDSSPSGSFMGFVVPKPIKTNMHKLYFVADSKIGISVSVFTISLSSFVIN